MRRFLIIYFLLLGFMYSQESQSHLSGDANFYYISKLDDGNLINLPYRMLNLSFGHQDEQFQLFSEVALEYQPNLNNVSFKMDDPQDFLIDLRELYMTWQLSFGELRLGKQIQTWGFVDENSPLDNSNAYDYNFLFIQERFAHVPPPCLAMEIGTTFPSIPDTSFQK